METADGVQVHREQPPAAIRGFFSLMLMTALSGSRAAASLSFSVARLLCLWGSSVHARPGLTEAAETETRNEKETKSNDFI